MSIRRRFALLVGSLAVSGLFLLNAQDKTGSQTQSSSQQSQEKADPAKFVGSWKMSSITPDGDIVAWTLTLKQAEGKLAGTISSESGSSDLKDITITGSKIHFVSPYQGEDYDEDLELDGAKLVGTWSGNGARGKTTGERSAS